MVQFCVKHGSPFCVNVYPFFARQHASKEFVLFGPDPGYEDQGLKYTDMFSAQYDAVVRAVSKLGIPGADAMEVGVVLFNGRYQTWGGGFMYPKGAGWAIY